MSEKIETKRDTREALLQAGREEFLAKGFKDASLRKIARTAGVTTGAVYGCFPGKEALFTALVEPVAGNFLQGYREVHRKFEQWEPAEQIKRMHDYTEGKLEEFIDYLYDNLTVFRLLILRAEGTRYACYLDRLIAIETESTVRFIRVINQVQGRELSVSADLMHILTSGFYKAMFETVAHDMSREEAARHIRSLSGFYSAGWDRLLGLE